MNTARIVVLTIAVGAGGVAAYLASGSDPKAPAEPVVQLQTVDVLVAKNDIGLGQSVTADDVQWQTWPAATASNNFMRRNERPEATKDVIGSIARAPFIAGEPIREPKLVKANGSGLHGRHPADRHARHLHRNLAGNRRRRLHPPERPGRRHSVAPRPRGRQRPPGPITRQARPSSRNVRVLAIDQAPKEKDGQNSVVGKTATLELEPRQAETLARSRQIGTLSLALRSLVDRTARRKTRSTTDQAAGNGVNVVRYGVQPTRQCPNELE